MTENEQREQQNAEQPASVPESEIPFVPYAAEAFADEEEQRKRFKRLLIPIGIVVLLAVILIGIKAAKKNNFYQQTIASLRFDYRSGEIVMTDSASRHKKGTMAEDVYDQIKGHAVSIHAVQYYLKNDRSMDPDISEYQFTHNGEGDSAEIEIGTAGAVMSRKQTVRRTASGVQIQDGNSWENASDINLPPLYDYCFAITSSNGMEIGCKEAYETYVNGASMVCEIWLMNVGNAYYTLYRYYTGSTLTALRVLNSSDDLMCVYDIKNYTPL